MSDAALPAGQPAPLPINRRMITISIMLATIIQALDTALGLSDGLQARALAQFTPAERAQLVALLAKAREGLLSLQTEELR